jgi:hypothetical protein
MPSPKTAAACVLALLCALGALGAGQLFAKRKPPDLAVAGKPPGPQNPPLHDPRPAVPTADHTSGSASTAHAADGTPAGEPPSADLSVDLPHGIEYPIKVKVAVWVNNITKLDEVEGCFSAELDVRLTWNDPRLGLELKRLGLDRQEFGFDEAPTKLATIWTPQIAIANLDGKSTSEDRVGLIIHARGAAEILRRIHAKFKSGLNFSRFPFDTQALTVELRSPKYGAAQVVFAHEAEDRHQSGVKAGIEIPNWHFDPRVKVTLASGRGWTGRDHSVSIAEITARRETGQYFFQLFLPFFTIMLFPPLALWVPKAEVMARASMTFNGLFSLIGFSYSIFIRYPMLAAVDNVIVRMLYVAYIFLAAVLGIIMTVHNPNFTANFGGKHLWAEAAAWTTWSAPLLFALAIGSMILFSM